MKKLNSFFFILYLLLITGGFAAIAQNSYGITILGWSTAAFAFLCSLGAIFSSTKSNIPRISILEYVALAIIFAIASLRVFLIHFVYVEVIFSMAATMLAIVYLRYIIHIYNTLKNENRQLFVSLALFYACITIFTLSLALNPISNFFSQIAGFIGVITFIMAVLSAFRIKSITAKGSEISITKYLSIQANSAMLLLSLYLLLTVYSATTLFNIIPGIHSSKMPKGYYELVKSAENGTDLQEDGKYTYQLYKERMEHFMKKQGLKN